MREFNRMSAEFMAFVRDSTKVGHLHRSRSSSIGIRSQTLEAEQVELKQKSAMRIKICFVASLPFRAPQKFDCPRPCFGELLSSLHELVSLANLTVHSL